MTTVEKKKRVQNKLKMNEISLGNGLKLTFNPEKNPCLGSDNEITLRNINMNVEEKDVLFNESLNLKNGKRCGFVGQNKWERILLKKLAEKNFGMDMEVVYWTKDIVIVSSEISVYDYIFDNLSNVYEEKLEHLKYMEENNMYPAGKKEIRQLKIELMLLNPKGSSAEGRRDRILAGLGFSMEKCLGLVNELPEHLKRKLSLARALFRTPSILILDEPTSVLDINSLIWLENYLQSWEKILLVISQDRMFLNIVCQEIICIHQEALIQYEGNYSSFEEFLQNKKSSEAQHNTENDVTLKNSNGTGFHIGEEEAFRTLDISFQNPSDSRRTGIFLLFRDITFHKNKKRRLVLSGADHEFYYKPAIAVLGASGIGKSALLKLASGQLKPQKGMMETMPKEINIGVLDESSIHSLKTEQNVISYLMETCNINNENIIKKQLNHLGFPNAAHTSKIKDLSVDEKAKIIVTKFCLVPYDAIFLDDPTRYFGIRMIEALQKAVYNFKGAILIITNNEYLIQESECELCVIENLKLMKFEDLSDYKKRILKILGEPVKVPLKYSRKTPLNIDLRPKLVSDSEIIINYIKSANADPDILNIGNYFVEYIESYKTFLCSCSTFPPLIAGGRTKEQAERRIRLLIEWHIENLINEEKAVPSPP